MSRPQVGIKRLPVIRASQDAKEVMNCKSCRKRKIKCNRIKPSCGACQVFNCVCIYDAVPKKRGPKTDVLETLLKRVNGLKKQSEDDEAQSTRAAKLPKPSQQKQTQQQIPSDPEANEADGLSRAKQSHPGTTLPSQPMVCQQTSVYCTELVLDTYFARLHDRPYYILDERATRQRNQNGLLPQFLINALCSITVRLVPQICENYADPMMSSKGFALQSRAEIDVDEPTIDRLQALLLLTIVNMQCGKGKKAYMLLSHATSMATALGLHRELLPQLQVTASERESRRKLFWTCYLMDRFLACGSQRPSFISDDSVYLRLPAWQPVDSPSWLDGDYFPSSSSLPFASGISNAGHGSGAILMEIARVLGRCNRYLAGGGVQGDSHFPWHTQSTLSKIRNDLDFWAANTQDAFRSLEVLFGRRDSSTLVLSKLVYHLIHCLIYRPFLPLDLSELSGYGQSQSWQVEATNWCFLHANAIVELVKISKDSKIEDWPSFVAYCLCTAGTVHVHGAHYLSLQDNDVFSRSHEFLTTELAELAELRLVWTGAQHQLETLQVLHASHSQLLNRFASDPMRNSSTFQMEDFFDRYPGPRIDGAYVTFGDFKVEENNHAASMWTAGTHGETWSQLSLGTNPSGQSALPSQHFGDYTLSLQQGRKRRRTLDKAKPTAHLQGDLVPGTTSNQLNGPDIPTPTQTSSESDQISSSRTAALETGPLYDDYLTTSAFPQRVMSPSFSYSPVPHSLSFDQQPITARATPDAISAGAESTQFDADGDPFLSLLEQLADHDGSDGGFNGLDIFLDRQIDAPPD